MKKTIVLSFVIIVGMALFSCKPEKKEWNIFYGYVPSDIVGEYSFSGAPDAFSSLIESEDGIICQDALVSVTSLTEQTVNVNVNCPDHDFQKSFTGRPSLNANPFNILMSGNWNHLKHYSLTSEVLKNEQGNIRLVGFVNEDHYKREYNLETQVYDTVYDHSVKRYFDVINH